MKRKYASQNPLEKQKYIEKVKRSKITRNNQWTINEQNQKYYETIQKIIQGLFHNL
ncbi:hypothetical protein ACJIZ3_013603 [Penstemon smallii]|uniref:Uncharacterized protein n=1 Tax=Penstemon smallii TaxID=265156 RepID=A0ABD3RHC6_9LAMI